MDTIAIQGYRSLATHLRQRIEQGEFKAGEKLPSENQMGRDLGLNRHTVRAALLELEKEGYITRIRGKGTFVSRQQIPYRISPATAFTATLEALGLKGHPDVLDSSLQDPNEDLTTALVLEPGEQVIQLEILRMVEGLPVTLTSTYLPAKRFPELERKALQMKSLYRLLEAEYDIHRTQRAWSDISAKSPGRRLRELLQMPLNLPLLEIKSLVKDQHGIPFEYSITLARSDSYRLHVNFEEMGLSS